MSAYVGKQVSVSITKTVEGDMGSFIAQEVTFEPKQNIEGVDALGSDTVQAWATGLKIYEGTIVEALKVGADGKKQFDRTPPFQTTLEEYTVKLIWDGGSGSKITVTLTGCIFPEPSIVSRKGEKAAITTKFKAKSASIAIA